MDGWMNINELMNESMNGQINFDFRVRSCKLCKNLSWMTSTFKIEICRIMQHSRGVAFECSFFIKPYTD